MSQEMETGQARLPAGRYAAFPAGENCRRMILRDTELTVLRTRKLHFPRAEEDFFDPCKRVWNFDRSWAFYVG